MADQKDHYSGHGGGAGAIRLYHDEAAGYYTEAQASHLRGWDATDGQWYRLPVDHTTGALLVSATLAAGSVDIGKVDQGTGGTSAWKVDGSAVTQPVSLAAALDVSDRAARLLGHVTVDNASLAVTGTFWQATQPVSGTVTANQGAAPWSENITQLGGTAIDTNSGNKSAGTQRVVIATDQAQLTNSLLVDDVGVPTIKPNTAALTTTATTADQVILTYTVTNGKTLYLLGAVLGARLTVLSATASILGTCSIETPSGTKILTVDFDNATSEFSDRQDVALAKPIPIASGVVIRVVCTPAAATSMLWRATLIGYEK